MTTQIPGMGSGDRVPESDEPRGAERSVRERLLVAAFSANRLAMYRVARRVCGEDEAADAVQEVFLRLWRDDTFDSSRSSIGAYLTMLTRSAAIDIVRRNTARRARDERHQRLTRPIVDEADHHLLGDLNREHVGVALDALNPIEREIIRAAFFEHCTYRQVSVRLGIPEGTVKSRARLAMAKLRYQLREEAS